MTTIASTGSSSGVIDECPAGIDGLNRQSAGVIAPEDWPWESMGAFVEDAICEAGAASRDADGYDILPLTCTKPELGPETYAVRLESSVPELEATLIALEGVTDLRLSFAGSRPLGPFGGIRHMTLRETAGELILLASYHPFAEAGAQLHTVDDPVDWPAPFSRFDLVTQGCPDRVAVRPGARFEEPLAVQLETDEGTVAIFDREVETVVVAGSTFDVFVFDAFRRSELNCGDCSQVEAAFLVLRTQ